MNAQKNMSESCVTLPQTCPLTNQTGNEAQLKQVGGESTYAGLDAIRLESALTIVM